MDGKKNDLGVISVLLKRFETERFPRAQDLKAKVESGGVLESQDLAYLDHVLDDAREVLALIATHPEYASLAKAVLVMYEEIMTKSEENRK